MRTLWRRLALGIAIAVSIPFAVLLYGWYGPGPSARVSDFTVKEGSSVAAVAGQLEKAKLISSARRFEGWYRLFGGADPIQAGEFGDSEGRRAASILDLLSMANRCCD